MVLAVTDQVLHCRLKMVNENIQMFTSFVYASNSYIERHLLSSDLNKLRGFVGTHPSIILGDFDASLCVDKLTSDSSALTIAIREFRECINAIEVVDMSYSGMNYSWNQSPTHSGDHSPVVIKIPAVVKFLPKMFRFSNYIVDTDGFVGVLLMSGACGFKNNRILILAYKSFCDLEMKTLEKYNDALWDEERFLKQRSKVEWLHTGDNTKYFHKMEMQFLTYLCNIIEFLDTINMSNHMPTNAFLLQTKISHEMATNMVSPVTDVKVKDAIFGIGDDKASAPDGYTSTIFKKSWDIVGRDVYHAVKEFFCNGQLLKEINHTIITLLPKVESPSKVNDCRPISYCNVIYKCISKIITNKIKGALDVIICDNQSAFVSGRRISDNILLTQKIMRNYQLDRGTLRCAFKVDNQKAYDTVD
ncbi:uncharacterized protein [Rutidosis leptorrhynchoides]|uniref:uncharacterized protein n=1 Tax=Rutidosis leptorrhynchoides TaxID=125765 RepID=UPI003A99E99B